jgi:PAS domain S-box-containing protein
MALVTPDGSWCQVNRRLCEITGYSAEELLARTFKDITYPDDIEASLALNRRLIEGEIDHDSLEKRYVRKDGSAVWTRLTIGCVRQGVGALDYAIAVIEDISEGKRAEFAQRESEERFRALVNASSNATFRMNPDASEMLEANGHGLFADTREPTTAWLAKYIHPDDWPSVQKALRQAVETKSVFDLEHRVCLADGTGGWARSRAVPLLDERGEIREWFGASMDITERKKGEEALRESAADLRLAVEAADLGIWHWDIAKGGEPAGDARCAEMLGAASGAPVRYSDWAHALVPEDRAGIEAALARAADPADPHDDFIREYRMQRLDGKMVWFSAHGRAIFEPDAGSPSGRRPIYMAGVVRDVTEAHAARRMQRERDRRTRYLLALEERLHACATEGEVLNAVCEAIGLELGASLTAAGELEPDGDHISISGSWSACGEPAQLIGRRPLPGFGARAAKGLIAGETVTVADVQTDPRTSQCHGAQGFYLPHGARSFMEVPLLCERIPRAVLLVASADVRAWTEAEVGLVHETIDRAWQKVERDRAHALRESEQRLRLLGDRLPEAAVYQFVRKPDGTARCNYVSAGVERLIGVPAEDLLQDARIIDELVVPEHRDRLIEAEQRSARDLSDFNVEVPVRKPDSEVRWTRFQSRPQRLPDGSVMWEGIATSINQQKRAEEALRESEERLRLAVEAADLGTWRLDAVSGKIEWNVRCKALFGLPPDAEVTPELRLNAIAPEDRGRAEAAFSRAVDPADPNDDYACEYRIRHPNGLMLWLASRGRAFFEPDPTSSAGRRPLFATGVTRDVTEARLSEMARREREKRDRYCLKLERLLQSATTAAQAVRAACQALGSELGASFTAVGELEPDREHLTFGSAWSLCGLPQLPGRHRLASIGAECLKRLIAGHTVAITDVLTDPLTAGDEPAEVAYQALGVRSSIWVPLIRDGRVQALLLIGSAAPRTWKQSEIVLANSSLERVWHAVERAQSEAALVKSEEQFRRFIEQAPAAIAMFDRDMRYIACSQRWLENHICSETNLVGRSHYEVFPEIPESWKEVHRRGLAGEVVRADEDPFERADGRKLWFRWEVRPWRKGNGDIGGITILTEDVTGKVTAAHALRESEERLAAALRAGEFGVYDLDLRTGSVKWDPAVYRLWVIQVGKPVTYDMVRAAFHPDDLAIIAEAEKRAFDPAGTGRLECEHRIVSRTDGKVRWVAVHGNVVFDQGVPVRMVGLVQDITGRKELQEKLRESEERFRGIFQHAGTGIAIADMGRRFLSCNPAFGSMLGYTENELREARCLDLVREDDREANSEALDRLDKGEISSFELINRFLRKDGKPVWVHKHVSLLRDSSGTPVNYIALVTDITERKRAEAALKESEERLRLAQQAGHLGVFDWNLVTNEAIWTAELEDIFGLPPGRFENSYEGWHKRVHPGDLPHLEALFAEWFQSSRNEEQWEYRYLRHGHVRWISARGRVYRDPAGKPVRMVGTNLDITERKEAEEILRRSELRYRHLVEQMSDGLFVADHSQRFLDVNPAGCAQLGMTREEVLSRRISDVLLPEEHARLGPEIARFDDGGLHTSEWRFLRKDGSVFVGEVRGRRLPNGNLQGVLRDITERKRAQEQVQLLMREMNHRSKNMLLLVEAVARQTIATAPDDFLTRFRERIHALAGSQDLLVKNQWKGADLEELVRSQLAHFKDLIGTRIGIAGPAVLLHARAAQTIGMALHELATNAGKYGALSNCNGSVNIAWQIERVKTEEERFVMTWREEGGPPVAEPSKRGFGSTVIASMAEQSLDGKVSLEFPVTGLIWRVECMFAELQG